MASFLDKTQLNTAITDNTKLDLGCQYIGTTDFMQLTPTFIREMVPGSKIDIKSETFVRLNPLPVPTYGRARIVNRAFKVPFRTIFRGWDDFLLDNVHVASDGSSSPALIMNAVPTVSNKTLMDVFMQSISPGSSADTPFMLYTCANATDPYDVTWSGATDNYCFSVRGRMAIKTLESLGYKINWDVNDKGIYSGMPLLALARIFADWYFPAPYMDTAAYDTLLSLCNYDMTSTSGKVLDDYDVTAILLLCTTVCYGSDMFTAAWDTPNQPSVGNHSDFKLVNIDTAGSVYGSSNTVRYLTEKGFVSNNSSVAYVDDKIGGTDAPFITPYVGTTSSSYVATTPISQYLLHSLHALSDWMKRNQLAGARSYDRMLARFGKALSPEKLNRSVYLGASSQDILFGDVMGTADTVQTSGGVPVSGSQLGSYAGKGVSYGEGHFSCESDEFAYVIVLTSVVPVTGYFQGVDPQVKRISKMQYYQPEFDSLGSEPIEADTLFIPQIATTMPTGNPRTQIFGFSPRFATYKCSTCSDRVVGNFRLLHLNGTTGNPGLLNAGDSWHLMRTFNSADFNGDWSNCVHSVNFVYSFGDLSQYKRIYYNQGPEAVDNMTLITNFEVGMYAPMSPLYDSYDFEDKGKKVTLDVNGVKMN